MKNITKIIAAAVLAVTMVVTTQSAKATSITGGIAFSGSAQLDGSSVSTSSEVLSWGNNFVTLTSGSFVGTSGTVTFGSVPWLFSSAESGFWSVGGFTFNLTSAIVTAPVYNSVTGYYSLTVYLTGTVSAAGYDTTAMTGTITFQDPTVGGTYNYSGSMSFATVPDGGTTALLLGSALSGLALIRRKLSA